MIHAIILLITSQCAEHGWDHPSRFASLSLIRETAGEEDHAAYNLGVLKKPVYALSDEEILANGGRSGMQNLGLIHQTALRCISLHGHALSRLYGSHH